MGTSEISPSSERDIQLVLSIPEERVLAILESISKIGDERGIYLGDMQEILQKSDLSYEVATAFESLIYNLFLLEPGSESMASFLKSIEVKFPTNSEVVLRIIRTIINSGIIEQVQRNSLIVKTEVFGIPHLSAVGLMPEYRILEVNNHREVVPVVICDLVVHENIPDSDKDDTKITSKKLTFQMNPNTLDFLISELTQLKNKLESDRKLVSVQKGEKN